ncbi:hypothetical protein [Asticcacaulis sp.]|uniref:hypothetical protein n=1 Tax=Asticcacaulis sp. TaxID=1872648 RepID=UPI003F7B8BD6
MSDMKLDEGDIRDLFAATPIYEDAAAFEARVMRGLRLKLWLRQGFVALAGVVGGLYALAQFVRVPNWSFGEKVLSGSRMARVETDQTFRAGVEFFDVIGKNAVNLFYSSLHYLGIMQTPIFFWVSFSLCFACLALYYAYSQEETI